MSIGDLATIGFGVIGIFFFIAGTLGLLRFPDMHSRLHALTKADNLGLGFIVLAVLPQVDQIWLALKLVLVWALALFAAATMSQLVARAALTGGEQQRRNGR